MAVAPINSNYFYIISSSSLVSLVVAVIESISIRCHYKNFFCDSVSIELSFNSLFIIMVGFYSYLFFLPYSSNTSLPIKFTNLPPATYGSFCFGSVGTLF